jgi:hypothetical protein
MPADPPARESLPGASRTSFRQFFLGLGSALLLLPAAFYLRRADLPPPILIIVGGMGALLVVIGLLCPSPAPLTTQEWQNRTLAGAEEVLRTGPASHQRRWENRAGSLTLTSRRLVFLSHGLNLDNADLVIPLADITVVEPARTLGIIPNAFRVVLGDGTRHQFTVFGRKAWMDAVREVCRLG